MSAGKWSVVGMLMIVVAIAAVVAFVLFIYNATSRKTAETVELDGYWSVTSTIPDRSNLKSLCINKGVMRLASRSGDVAGAVHIDSRNPLVAIMAFVSTPGIPIAGNVIKDISGNTNNIVVYGEDSHMMTLTKISGACPAAAA